MKKLFGYLVAAVFGGIAFVLSRFGQKFSALIDMVYPYVIRTLEATLAEWSSQVDFLIWQLLAVALVVVVLGTLVPILALKKSVVRWFGWVLACAAFVFMVYTVVFGMNQFAGPLSEDLRMEVTDTPALADVVDAAIFYRNQANTMAERAPRDSYGRVDFAAFSTLAQQAGGGFEQLTKVRFFPIFAGSTLPVKKLGLADLCTSMGITGLTFGLTGESAVNPQIPDIALPYTMCREMAKRMCIVADRDANFAAFLACSHNGSREFQYSAYFMAYYYCYNALIATADPTAASEAVRISQGVNDYLRRDMEDYDAFFRSNKSSTLADTLDDEYLKFNGKDKAMDPYSDVCKLLTSWHYQEVVLPAIQIYENPFDPYDESQVDLTGIVNARG